MEGTREYEVMRVEGDNIFKKEDYVIIEYPFTIFLNDNEFITLLCTPSSLEHLAIGFLHSEGLIKNREDVTKVRVDNEKGIAYVYTKNQSNISEKLYGKRTITTGCGKGTVFYNVVDSFRSKKIENNTKIDIRKITDLIRKFNKESKLFLKTGGVHSCALSDSENIIIFEEDIGRHNALDKIIGKVFMENIDVSDKMILTSGRISSEVLIKMAKVGIPIIVSRSAPTNLTLEIAKDLNITVIGFVRGDKMNIYSNFPSLNS